jgi:hypothetical protein
VQLVLPLLKEHQKVRWIRTANPHLKIAHPEDDAAALVEFCRAKDYSILPVVKGDAVVGVIFPQAHDYAGRVANSMHPAAEHTIGRDEPLVENIERLANAIGLLVIHEGKLDGVVTYSDLNRRSFRVLVYAHIAELEGRMADIARRDHPDADVFLGKFSEHLSDDVEDRWQHAIAEGVAIHPVEQCDLSDLLAIFRKDAALRQQLGYPTSSSLQRDLGGLVDTRHAIMHPVRPLIRSADDAHKLWRRIQAMGRVLETTNGLGGEPLEILTA